MTAEQEELVEADGQQAIPRDPARAGVDGAYALFPPVEALAPGPRIDESVRLAHPRRRRVAAVADGVDELGLREEVRERLSLSDRVAALLDQAVGIGPLPPHGEEVVEETAARRARIVVEVASKAATAASNRSSGTNR